MIGSSNVDGSGHDSSRDDPDFTKRDDTSRVSNRGLVDNSFNFQRKKKRAAAEATDEAKGGKQGVMKGGAKGGSSMASEKGAVGKRPLPHPMNQPKPIAKQGGDDEDSSQRRESENSKEGEDADKDNSLDHNKMLKDIKISNNKLNMVTLSVIVIFLTYFSTCFGVSLNYLNDISNQVDTNTKLYSEQPALEYTYLYFLTDILLDNSAKSNEERNRYLQKVTQMY